MSLKEFLNRRYVEWRGDNRGNDYSIKSWARFLGVSETNINSWMNRGSVPKPERINLLTKLFGYEVYNALGLEIPKMDSGEVERMISPLKHPEEAIESVAAALVKAHAIASKRGIEIDSPEGYEIIKRVLLEAGFDFG